MSEENVFTSAFESEWERIKNYYSGSNNNNLPESKSVKESSVTSTVEKIEHKPISKNYEETKKLLINFKEKVSKYPKYLSNDGSVKVCVALSMNKVSALMIENLPQEDQSLIRSLVPDKFNISSFSVTFDDNNDFNMGFLNPEKELYQLTMFNSVIHPKEDTKSITGYNVPVEKDGNKISIGNFSLTKKDIKRLIGTESSKNEDEYIQRRQPVAGRNAYEIRNDVLQMAIDLSLQNKISDPDEIVEIAKQFYKFVENKR